MKRVIAGLALALAVGAYAAHPQTLNKEGFVGVNKTQSGQSLGHSKLAFFALMDYADGYNNLNGAGTTDPRWGEVSKFMGLSANVGFALGIWHYFDVGMALPVFYDNFSLPIKDPTSGEIANDDGRKTGGIGNLKADLKARFPLPEDQPMDVAVFFSAAFPTADQNKQGLWIRELEYINKETGEGHAFGTSSTTMKFGLAATADFSKLDGGDGLPFLIHVNGGYRYTSSDGSVYLGVPFVSAAAEYYFIDFLSIFAEYFMDIQTEKFNGVFNNNVDENLEMQQLTGAVVFHTPVGLDIHLGASYYLGGDNMVSNITTWQNEERQGENAVILEKTRVNPEYTVYGGITWSGFLLPQDRDGDGVPDNEDKCPDDYGHRLNQGCPLGNPDSDEDGVCDAWVAEKGFEDEFSDICEGVDMCPNEPGEGDDGCPLDNPDPDEDGVCDPWVSQKGLQKKFKDVCTGIDECPAQPGPVEFNGCKTKQPDPDGDGMCSPWVIDEGVASSFSNVCAGYDMCPGEAGPKANKGCPWDDPDSDGDGICDPWVTEKKMGYYFEKAAEDKEIAKKWFIEKSCKGIDKCPTEAGPANNEGCPLGEPDTDGDGLCDPWVTEKKMLEQFEDICHGVDQCPTEAGPEWAKGCPMDNPDADGDSLCASWVFEKSMHDQFKDICPTKTPDNCPVEPGPAWNKGCPFDDDPDPDGDGVCSEWVATKKLQKQFENVCKGIDRCPDEPGADGHGCPVQAPEKLTGVTFKSGKATLESNAKTVLKGVAKKLTTEDRYKDLNIVIQGHTDNVGKSAKNQKLSLDRAKAVMNLLIKSGVKKNRIKAVGCGDTAPVADNKTADGREENRRIEMHYVTPDDDGTKCVATFTE